MLSLLQPISASIGTPSASALAGQLINDYNGSGTLAYNRNTSDSKVTYNPSDQTSIFGRYSVEPFSVTDPQTLGRGRRWHLRRRPARRRLRPHPERRPRRHAM